MRTIYAVGDSHGFIDQIDRALALIEADGGPEARIVFLGDYVDRGPDSRAVIDRLMAGLRDGRDWHPIRGNHDRMFTRFVRGGVTMDPWMTSGMTWLHDRLGGQTTLGSYFEVPDHPEIDLFGKHAVFADQTAELAKMARRHVPETHLAFLENLPLVHEEPGLFFVHAGVNPKRPLGMQDEDDLLWIRDGWLDHRGALPSLVIHGHTALDTPQHHGNRVNLDGGAGYGRPLVPVAIETDVTHHSVFALSETGRKLLAP